jgi:hypothetical protein
MTRHPPAVVPGSVPASRSHAAPLAVHVPRPHLRLQLHAALFNRPHRRVTRRARCCQALLQSLWCGVEKGRQGTPPLDRCLETHPCTGCGQMLGGVKLLGICQVHTSGQDCASAPGRGHSHSRSRPAKPPALAAPLWPPVPAPGTPHAPRAAVLPWGLDLSCVQQWPHAGTRGPLGHRRSRRCRRARRRLLCRAHVQRLGRPAAEGRGPASKGGPGRQREK